MKKISRSTRLILIILPVVAVFAAICLFYSSRSIQASEDKEFTAFTNELFIQEVSGSTISLHYTLDHPENYGITDAPITYGNLSTDSSEMQEYLRYYRQLLHTFSPEKLSMENRLTWEILDDYLENSYNEAEYILYQEPLSPVTGIHAQLPVLLAEFPLEDRADLDDYLALLSVTPEYFRSIADFEKVKSENGLFCTDAVLDEILSQCEDFINMEDNYLISSFEERIENLSGMDEKLRKNYCEKNEQLITSSVIPAYRQLMESMEDLRGTGTNSCGLSGFPDGRSCYAQLVRSETGSDRSLSELEEMIATQISADLAKVSEIQIQNPSLYGEKITINRLNPKEIITQLQKNLSSFFPVLPDCTVQVKNVPESLEEHLSPAFYLIPPIDNLSDQTIYLNAPDEMDPLELFTTLAHEGYPGHMYQNTWMNRKSSQPLRCILNYGGYTEGWATYTEMISYYASGLSKPEAIIAQSAASANLGIYAYCDLKIHADGWTLTDTQKYLKQYGITDSEVVSSIYNLILGDPANYMKYYVGYLEFLDIKKEARDSDTNFSESDFHKKILEIGPSPFNILRKQVLNEN